MRARVPWRPELERVDLGSFAGTDVEAVVERRALGVAGRAYLEVGRTRVRAIEVRRAGRLQVVMVPRVADPWLRVVVGALLLWGLALIALAIWRRRERSRPDGDAPGTE